MLDGQMGREVTFCCGDDQVGDPTSKDIIEGGRSLAYEQPHFSGGGVEDRVHIRVMRSAILLA